VRRSRPVTWSLPGIDTDEGDLWLGWLIRLRWVAIVAQAVTVSVSFRLLDSPATTLPILVSVMVGLAAVNGLAVRATPRARPFPRAALLAHLSLDVVALTAFFVLAGGAENPFTALYLIHVAMGALMLPRRLAVVLSALVLACYGLILVFHLPLHLDRHLLAEHTLTRLGQLISFGITVVSVTGFVTGLAWSLRGHKEQLLEARERTARVDRLRAVGTLAAGAAHELNTPLGTVGLRIRRIGRRHSDLDTVADLAVIRVQLDHRKAVVEQLLVGAGDPSASGFERLPLESLVREAIALWCKGSPIPVQVSDSSEGLAIEVPRIAFGQALINLLENAREAQEEVGATQPIAVRITRAGREGVVEIADRGVGLPDDAAHIGDPFFTTKDTGTGLGVFVARALADGAGGGLSYSGRNDGPGTIARWWFPEIQRRSP
jgi:two-component system, sensor histidine kinase RegB